MLEQVYLDLPEDMPQRFVTAWNAKDALQIANLFAEDAAFVNVVGLWWNDRKAIWKAHDYGLRVIFPDSQLEVRKVKLRYLTDTTAVVHARMRLNAQSGHNKLERPGSRMNIFTFVLQKLEKGWVCMAAHNTDIVPGKETNIVDELGNLRAVDYRKRVR